MKMATWRETAKGKRKKGRREKKRVPQRRARGFVNAPLTTVLKIHSFICSASARPSAAAATLLPVQHVGSKEVAFTRTRTYVYICTRTGVQRGYPVRIRELSVYL